MATKPVVISLHGIRTRGEWQKRLAEILSANGMISAAADYGYLSLLGFMLSAKFGGKIEWFLRKYEEIISDHHQALVAGGIRRYPSLVAHSFGTAIVGLSMVKYEDIRFDKMIICGSILPEDFPWDLLFQRDQVAEVRHEYGAKDIWAAIGRFAPNMGTSGAKGFGHYAPRFVQQRYMQYRHSDFFSRLHIESTWLPVLMKEFPRLTIKHGRELRTEQEFELIASQTFEIDARIYGQIPEYKEVAPDSKLARQWLGIDPDVFTFLIDQHQQRCIGYITCLFVKPDRFDRLMDEGLVDKAMTPELLASSEDGKPVCMCALSIAIDPGHRDIGEGVLCSEAYRLLAGLCAKIEYLAVHRGVRVRQVGAVGWTEEGRRICENIIGMKKVAHDKYGHPIYKLRITRSALPKKEKKRFKPLERVVKTYEQMELQKRR
jgi:ferredoxin